MSIEQRTLGKTALCVTSVCAGASALGSMPHLYGYEVAAEDGIRTVEAVLHSRIRFLDTANGSAGGESERRIGAALRRQGGLPEGFVIATKVDPDSSGDFSGQRVFASVEESKRRLGLSVLPLVYLHDPEKIGFDQSMGPQGPVAALVELHARGAVGAIGVAGGQVELLRRFVGTGLFAVALTHNRYTLVDQSALPLIEDCQAAGVAVVNGAPFGGGVLAKGRSSHPRYAYGEVPAALAQLIDQVERLCREAEVPLASVALQFSLRDKRISSTIVGMTKPERAEEAERLADWPVPSALWAEIRSTYEALGAPHQPSVVK